MATETKTEKSELERLLEKNAYGPGLTPEEYVRARQLIASSNPTDELCWVCEMNHRDISQAKNRTIFDTGLCQSHAYYALATRK